MKNRALLFVLFCVCVEGIRGQNQKTESERRDKLTILGLFPLTGPASPRGQAQLAGVQLAFLDTLGQQMSIGSYDIHFVYNDSKCDPQEEARLVIQQYASTGTNLMVIGGNCYLDVATGSDVRTSLLNGIFTQVAFESIFVETPRVYTTLPTILAANDAIASFLKHNQWNHVTVVYQENGMFYQGYRALASKLRSENIDILVETKIQNGTIPDILQKSRSKIVILYLESANLAKFACYCREYPPLPGRYRWIAPSTEGLIRAEDVGCQDYFINDLIVFNAKSSVQNNKEFQNFAQRSKFLDLDDYLIPSAAYAYDAAAAMVTAFTRSLSETSSRKFDVVRNVFDISMKNIQMKGKTGDIRFLSNGRRVVKVDIYTFKSQGLVPLGSYEDELTVGTNISLIQTSDLVTTQHQLDGIPIYLLAITCAFACLGVIYALAIMAYNISKNKDRIIKMTSPNINVVVTIGCILAYGAVPLSGLNNSKLSLQTLENIYQASTYVCALSFTVIYGGIFAKTWRVYRIFKNMQINGKVTKDEHLLLGMCGMLMVDVAILVLWTFVDPIKCELEITTVKYNMETITDVVHQINNCASQYHLLWVALLYSYKVAILILGIYCAWQTRHVTLPSLKDSRYIYVIIYNVAAVGIIIMPIALVPGIQMEVKYAVTSLAIIIVTTATLTLAFVPKILLVRQHDKKRKDKDPVKFLFSESAKKTQAKSGSLMCGCFGGSKETNKPYSEEVVATEIETLKRTLKEKDRTIRELTDRLFYGSEKFQAYLRQPKQPTADRINERRVRLRTRSQELIVKPLDDSDVHRVKSQENLAISCDDLTQIPPTAKRSSVDFRTVTVQEEPEPTQHFPRSPRSFTSDSSYTSLETQDLSPEVVSKRIPLQTSQPIRPKSPTKERLVKNNTPPKMGDVKADEPYKRPNSPMKHTSVINTQPPPENEDTTRLSSPGPDSAIERNSSFEHSEESLSDNRVSSDIQVSSNEMKDSPPGPRSPLQDSPIGPRSPVSPLSPGLRTNDRDQLIVRDKPSSHLNGHIPGKKNIFSHASNGPFAKFRRPLYGGQSSEVTQPQKQTDRPKKSVVIKLPFLRPSVSKETVENGVNNPTFAPDTALTDTEPSEVGFKLPRRRLNDSYRAACKTHEPGANGTLESEKRRAERRERRRGLVPKTDKTRDDVNNQSDGEDDEPDTDVLQEESNNETNNNALDFTKPFMISNTNNMPNLHYPISTALPIEDAIPKHISYAYIIKPNQERTRMDDELDKSKHMVTFANGDIPKIPNGDAGYNIHDYMQKYSVLQEEHENDDSASETEWEEQQDPDEVAVTSV